MSNFEIELFVDDQSIETLNISDPIQPFEELNYSFTIPQDFSNVGDYNITVSVSHEDDEYENNNSLSVSSSGSRLSGCTTSKRLILVLSNWC